MQKSCGFCEAFSDNMQAMLDKLVAEGLCAGDSIAVGRFGKLVVRCNSGWENRETREPISDRTLFQMYSLTKPVTAVAVLQLYEQGHFALTDSVGNYLPAYKDVRVCHVREDGREELLPPARPITIHDLLTMTSGIVYSGTGLIGEKLDQLSEEMADSKGTAAEMDTLTYINRLADVPLAFAPGDHYQYGMGFDVLGALVEVCSGKPLDRYCREHIFAPLGMKDTTFLLTEAKKYHLAAPYTRNAPGCLERQDLTATPTINAYTQHNTKYLSGGSGLICTLDDYFQFAKMLANNGKSDAGEVILTEASLHLMSAPQLTAAQRQTFAQDGDTCLHAVPYSYGYGVRVMTDPRNHLPVGEWGWAGTMGTWMSIDPQNEIFWVYAHQITPSDFEQHVPALSKLIYDSLL